MRKALIVAMVMLASCASTPKTTYSTEVRTIRVVNPATVIVAVAVTNTGDEPGRPDCLVAAEDPSGAYEGFDTFTSEDSLAPGETNTLRAELTITNKGAAFVTQGSADCD